MSIQTLNTKEIDKLMDPVGWRILEELQADARINYVELGKRVGLTSPAVAERVRRMEDAGIITGYRVVVNPTKVGLPIQAIIRLRASNCRMTMDRITMHYENLPEILECYRISGEDALIMRVSVGSMLHLENLVDRLNTYGDTITSVVFSSFQSRGVCNEILAISESLETD